MDKISLLEAIPGDAALIAALVHQAFQEYEGKLDPPSSAHRETAEQVLQRMTGGRVVVALRDQEPIGCCFYEHKGDHLYFSRLSVLPAYRRQGIGLQLIAYVEGQARAGQLRRVRLGVRLALERLRAYYERLGYQIVDYRKHDRYAQPTYVILEKTLKA